MKIYLGFLKKAHQAGVEGWNAQVAESEDFADDEELFCQNNDDTFDGVPDPMDHFRLDQRTLYHRHYD